MAGTSSVKSRYALLPGHDDAETGRDSRDHLSPIARIRKSPARGRAFEFWRKDARIRSDSSRQRGQYGPDFSNRILPALQQ
jgi:hypothetical protein